MVARSACLLTDVCYVMQLSVYVFYTCRVRVCVVVVIHVCVVDAVSVAAHHELKYT